MPLDHESLIAAGFDPVAPSFVLPAAYRKAICDGRGDALYGIAVAPHPWPDGSAGYAAVATIRAGGRPAEVRAFFGYTDSPADIEVWFAMAYDRLEGEPARLGSWPEV